MYNQKENCITFSFLLIYEDTVVTISCLLVSRLYFSIPPELSANILTAVHTWSSYFFTESSLSLFAFLSCNIIISKLYSFYKSESNCYAV